MTAILKLLDVLETRNVLGECVLWHAATATLWWTDIQCRVLFRYDPARGATTRFPTPDRLCSFAFTREAGRLIVAFAGGIALFEPETGRTEWLYRLASGSLPIRFNDGRTDRDGRFWTGTMVEGDARVELPPARLFCVGADRRAVQLDVPVTVINALCVSPDGTQFYYSDMPQRAIFVCDLDRDSGRIANRRIFARTETAALPDGATVDVEGCLWNAHWGAWRIVRYASDGRLVETVSLPVSQPTCVAFGGEKMNLLFVTSAREGLSDNALTEQPLAGNLLIYETDVTGIADAHYV